MGSVPETGVSYTVCSLSVLATDGEYPVLPDRFTSELLSFPNRLFSEENADVEGVEGVSNGSCSDRVGARGSSLPRSGMTMDWTPRCGICGLLRPSPGGGGSVGIAPVGEFAIDVGGYKNDDGALVSRLAGIDVVRSAWTAWELLLPVGAYEWTTSDTPNLIIVRRGLCEDAVTCDSRSVESERAVGIGASYSAWRVSPS